MSCDAPLSGPYCARCGERALEPEALTLRHFLVHTVAHELLNVDGTLWRTLRLLFVRPGRLSLEYAAGRRRPYVNPFRLLLIAIVAYALMSSSGRIATLNFGPVTVSMAPAAIRRSLSVENTIEQIDRIWAASAAVGGEEGAAGERRGARTVPRPAGGVRAAGLVCQRGAAGRDAASRLPAEAAPIPRARRVQHARRQLRSAIERDADARIRFRFWLGGYMFLVMS